MENNDNQILRLSIAAFVAILAHTVLALSVYWLNLSLLEHKERTIPFKLIHADKSSQLANSSQLSATENAKAAEEYLATLKQSDFLTKTPTKQNKNKHTNNNSSQLNSKQTNKSQLPQMDNSRIFKSPNSKTAINGLQDIFAKTPLRTTHDTKKQISSKQIEELSDYEITLLNILAKDSLYDPFHKVMTANQRSEIEYVITLKLFPNGAIKNARIKQASGLKLIDDLAIQTAYRASPFPPPPRDDIQKGYSYDIPIIYQTKGNKAPKS